ncbi:MAG: hypothetical protein HYR94_22195 [Chloroflexi bacterium]|nr:hypothetical protein [Chloroflexota bacterium]
MLLSMAKVQIIGTKRCQDKTIRLLQRLGVVQVETWDEGRLLSQQRLTLGGEVMRLRERLAYMAARVEAVLTVLPAVGSAPPSEPEAYYAQSPDEVLSAVEVDLAEVEPQAQALTRHRDQLEEQLLSLARYETTLRQLLPVIPVMVDLEHYAVTAIWLERRYQPILNAITRQLEDLTEGRCEVIAREVNPDIFVAVLVFPKDLNKPWPTLVNSCGLFPASWPTSRLA